VLKLVTINQHIGPINLIVVSNHAARILAAVTVNFIFMLDVFNSRPGDVKGIRNAIVKLVKEQLQKSEGGEGRNIQGIHLYIFCPLAARQLYQAALYMNIEGRFRNEDIQRVADDYAIDLPADWALEITFIEEAPPGAIKSTLVDCALLMTSAGKPSIYSNGTLIINVVNGQAERETYTLTSAQGKVNIGRENKVKMADGFFRINHIAFLGDDKHKANRSVSRQHAHIEWNAMEGCFYIFADMGGIPPGNKTKISRQNEAAAKMQTMEIGYRLQHGDQVMLGGEAVLEILLEG